MSLPTPPVFPDDEAYERSLRMPAYGKDLLKVVPPLNRHLEGTSAWINDFTGAAQRPPAGWDAWLETEVVSTD